MTEPELLFTHIFNCKRTDLYLYNRRPISKDDSDSIVNVLRRRIKGEPIQYILGRIEFMGLEFKLTPDVFIPRPETEILVEIALKIVHSSKFIVHSILDIGTGSGCIAISLAKFLKDVRVSATDISEEALGIAKQNALLNNVKINFFQSNLFSNYELPTANYELIVSNPPYIPSAEINNLEPELNYEPRIALDGGRDGLDFYRCIIKVAPAYLKKGGFLITEIGFNQCLVLKELFNAVQNFEIIEIVKDYNNIDRVIVARYKS